MKNSIKSVREHFWISSNTENELFEARRDYLDAHYAEQYAKYRVMNATGNLLDSLLIAVPSEWVEQVEY